MKTKKMIACTKKFFCQKVSIQNCAAAIALAAVLPSAIIFTPVHTTKNLKGLLSFAEIEKIWCEEEGGAWTETGCTEVNEAIVREDETRETISPKTETAKIDKESL